MSAMAISRTKYVVSIELWIFSHNQLPPCLIHLMTFPFISIKSIPPFRHRGPISSKKIAPVPSVNMMKPESIAVVAKADIIHSNSQVSIDASIETISSQKSTRVTFKAQPQIYYYDNEFQTLDHSKLFYTSRDYRRFEVEADIEESREKLGATLQSMHKRKRSGATDGDSDKRREDLLTRVANQFCMKVQ